MKILKKNINKYKLFLKEKIEKNDFDLDMNYIDFYDKYYDNEVVTNVPEQHRELIFNETKFKLKEIYENTKQEIRQKYLSFIEKEFPPDKVRLITTIDHIKNVLKLKKEYLSVSSKTERNEIIKEYLDKVKSFIKNRNDHIEQKKKEEEENIEPENIENALKDKKIVKIFGENEEIFIGMMNSFIGNKYNEKELKEMVDNKNKIKKDNEKYKTLYKIANNLFPINYINYDTVPVICEYGGNDSIVGIIGYIN